MTSWPQPAWGDLKREGALRADGSQPAGNKASSGAGGGGGNWGSEAGGGGCPMNMHVAEGPGLLRALSWA